MYRIIVCLVALFLMVVPNTASSFPSKNQDCSKCHSLKKEEADTLLKVFNKDIKVLSVGRSKAKYLWEVSYESEGKKGLIYIDLPKKHLISGSVLDLVSKKNITQEKLSELNKVNVSQIPLKDALVIGDRNAKQKVIVFTDPDCPYCGKLHAETKKLVAERKDIAFYVKMFPLAMHPGAYEKAKAIVCEKSLRLLDEAFENKQLPAAKCKTTVIDENIKLANKLGITGTPALIMPDGRVVSGFHDAQSIKNLIDKK
jgi:thiol:disulfide interchange protein DsbC